jgi:hypothetical protein
MAPLTATTSTRARRCKCAATAGCANLVYVITIMAFTVLGLGLRYGGVDLNLGFSVGTQGPSICTGSQCSDYSYSICNSDGCTGYWAVYRLSFTLAGFFLVLCLLTAGRCRLSSQLHRGFWFAKAFVLLGIFAGTLFAPNDMFAYFAWVARFIAPLFLLYQVCVGRRAAPEHLPSSLLARAPCCPRLALPQPAWPQR